MRREFKRIGEVMRKAITPKYGKEFSASTGLSDGTVDAGGGWMWCVMDSSGQPIKAYNGNKVPVQARLKVKLGYQKGDPRVLRILRVRNVWDEIIPSALGYHGSTHTFPGPDTAWIEQAQYMPLMVQPKSGFVVSIREGVIQWGADVVTVPSQDFDLSADYVSTGARWALIQADNTGTVSRKLGALVDTQWLLTNADIPAPDTDNVSLAAIMLYTGQELISRNQYVNDIRDLRTWYGGGGGGGTGDVTGPASAANGNLASYDGTTGKVIKDSGIAAADVITDPETVVSALVDYGPNLIVNGTFNTDAAGWNVGTGWAWESDGAGGGWMRHTAGNTAVLSQGGALIDTAVYAYTINIGGTTGSVTIAADDGDTFTVNATDGSGYNFLSYLADAGLNIKIIPSSDFDGYVDTVGVYRPPYVQEAKIDGLNVFGRRGATWLAVTEEAPSDGTSYVRKNSAWTAFPNADWSAVSGDALILNKPTITNPPTTTAANDVQVGNGSGAWIKKTLAEFVTILRTALDSVYAASAKGVTNGDSHDHSGGDGAQIDYSTLSGLPTLGGAAALNVGTTAGTVAAGNDSRFTDARTPTAHATTHKSGGSDAIKLDELAAPTDVTTLNASTTAHGLLLKATAPASGLLSLVGIGNGETAYSLKAIFDTTNPAALGTAGPGTALVAARRDHVHALPRYAIPLPAHGLGGTVGASVSTYAPFYYLGLNATAYNWVTPRAGTIQNIRVTTTAAQPASGSLVIYIRVNSVNSALSLTIPAGSAAGDYSNLSTTLSVNAGDKIIFYVTNNATGTSANIGVMSAEILYTAI